MLLNPTHEVSEFFITPHRLLEMLTRTCSRIRTGPTSEASEQGKEKNFVSQDLEGVATNLVSHAHLSQTNERAQIYNLRFQEALGLKQISLLDTVSIGP